VPSLKVSFAPRARNDIARIHLWLSERSPISAVAVISAIRSTAELVGEYPHIGRASDIEGVKSLPVVRFPYIVYYTLEPD
jgi:toxin ParE1/3/4